MKDKIIQMIMATDGYIYGLSDQGSLYKIDPLVKKTWELVQYAPYTQEVKTDGNKIKK